MRYLVFGLLLACGGKQAGPSNTADPAPGPKAPDNALKCTADKDCPEVLACGPCNTGEVVTSDAPPECVVNPCGKSIHAGCSNGVCVVK